MRGFYRYALAAGLAALAMRAEAQIPRPSTPTAKPKPTTAAPDPVYEAARSAFDGLAEPLRKGIQDALVWTGDYNAVTAGTFGRRTYDGILAFQARIRAEPTGILTPPQRAALDAAGEAGRRLARFKVQADAASGTVIGVPERLVPNRNAQPGGTRWQSLDGRITLDTKSFAAGETDLDGLFERAIAGGPERRITYKLKKPDFIVVTGETANGRSYLRYAKSEAGIRGFSIGYAKPLAGEVDKLVIAIANSFIPFPENAVTASGRPSGTVASLPVSAATQNEPVRPAATGLILAPGRVLTSAAALEGCQTPRIAATSARIAARDLDSGLALLEFDPRPVPNSPASVPGLRSEPLQSAEALVVLGAEAKGAASVAPAVVGTEGAEPPRVFAPLQPGAGGAPVLDRSGRLAGLIMRFPEAPRLVAGVMPPSSYALVPGSAVARFLADRGITVSTRPRHAVTLGAAAGPFISAVTAIECRR